jgi:hypothetical protein
MVTVTKAELENLEIPLNFVLVKLTRANDEIILNKGGLNEIKIFVPINIGNQEVHAPVYGEVVVAPSEIGKGGASEWATDCEVEPGDEVVLYYLDVVQALGGYRDKEMVKETDNRIVIVEDDPGVTYCFVRYSSIQCKIDGEDIIPVNGYIVGELIERSNFESGGLTLGVDAHGEVVGHRKHLQQQMRVLRVGKPVNKYYHGKFDDYPVEAGDIVYLRNKNYLFPLEVEFHAHLKKQYHVTQRRFVAVTVPEPVEESW